MSKKLIAVVLLMFALCLTACGDSTDTTAQADSTEQTSAADLAGTWKGTAGEISILTLGSNGSYMDDAGDVYIKGTYTVNTSDRTITVNESEYGLVFVYSYELADDTLTIQTNGGLPRKFIRQ
ncbi:MAG: hypothetical protein K6G43_09805 [Lachnospiraceae bacterium]|nr:hypothetical protein [Lachnospiraceae bacterium]